MNNYIFLFPNIDNRLQKKAEKDRVSQKKGNSSKQMQPNWPIRPIFRDQLILLVKKAQSNGSQSLSSTVPTNLTALNRNSKLVMIVSKMHGVILIVNEAQASTNSYTIRGESKLLYFEESPLKCLER